MEYILLDNFNGNFSIIHDDSGEPEIFDDLKSAQDSLDYNCQDGTIIPLDLDIIKLLRVCKSISQLILPDDLNQDQTNAIITINEVLGN